MALAEARLNLSIFQLAFSDWVLGVRFFSRLLGGYSQCMVGLAVAMTRTLVM
jgi:hypothetical protein